MASRVLTIEINKLVTKICEVDSGSKNPKIHKCFSIDTPEGLLVDDMIQPNAIYEDALHTAIRENDCKAKKVIFTVASAKIANREVEIPYVKDNRVGDVVKAKAGEYFPVNLEDYKVAYSILGTVGEGADKKRKVQILAVPLTLLESYYQLADRCGLEIEAIDYMGNSLYQATKSLVMSDTEVIAKIDESSTVVMVIKNRELVSYRNIAYGVNEAIQTLIDFKNNETEGSELGYEEAVEMMRQNLFIHSTDPNRVGENKVVAEVTGSLQYLVNNITRVVDFYNSRAEEHISRLHVTGLGGTFKGMAEFMGDSLGVPATSIRNIDRLVFPRNFDRMYVGDYVGCLGAVLAPLDMKLDVSKKKGGAAVAKKENYTIYVIACVAGLAAAAGLIGISLLNLKEVEERNEYLKDRVEKLAYTEEVYNTYLASKNLSDDIDTMYALTENHNDDLNKFILELERKMPSDVIVMSFNGTKDGVNLTFSVSSKESAAMVLRELAAFDSIEMIETSSIADAVEAGSKEHTVSFAVTAVYADEVEDAETAE